MTNMSASPQFSISCASNNNNSGVRMSAAPDDDDGDNEPLASGTQNPMTNPVVLNNLFEVCDFNDKDLSQFRLVSKDWCRASLKSWRSSATLHISDKKFLLWKDDDGTSPKFLEYEDEITTDEDDSEEEEDAQDKYAKEDNNKDKVALELDDFVNRVKENSHQLASKPFSSVSLRHGICRAWPAISSKGAEEEEEEEQVVVVSIPEHYLEFWRLCGGWLKKLVLDTGDFYDLNYFRDILFRETPNLQKLEITWCHFKYPVAPPLHQRREYTPQRNLQYLKIMQPLTSHNWPLQWDEIVTCFPNLNVLRIINYPIIDEPDSRKGPTLVNLLVAIIKLRKNVGVQLPLKFLDIMEWWSPGVPMHSQFPALFRAAQLPLETLIIDLGWDTPESVAQQLLQQFSSSLRTLRCTNASTAHIPYANVFGNQTFEQLRELRVSNYTISNFKFLRNTPNLESLQVKVFIMERRMNQVKVDDREDGDEHFVELGRLTEFETDCIFGDEESFLRIAGWMPNLTRLRIPLNKTTFPIACSSWNLSLKELCVAEGSDIGDEEITGSGSPDSFNITDLRALETFKQDKKGVNYLSCNAVVDGFLLVPNLNSLTIFVEDELPPDVMQRLKDKVSHLVITTKVKSEQTISASQKHLS